MTELSTIGVVGLLDGVVPVYDPSARWCWWNIDELWDGNIGAKRYVPKINDYVIDPPTFTTWIVKHIDPVTLIPRLELIRPANMSFSFVETDVLFGVGPGTPSETYRVYLDTSVVPYVLSVDTYLYINGTMSSYAKIFKGVDTSSTGKVISMMFDGSGNFITNNVPLELVQIDSHINYSRKVVQVCYTNETMVDAEIVTVVIYNDAGHVVSKRQLLVENTSFIRSLNSSLKYISHISLESPFISPTMDHVIEFPLDTPLNTLSMMGVVNYSDGSTLKLPVDGTKFRILGMDQYISTIIGQQINLALTYSLSPDEVVYGAVSADGKYITEPYSIVTVEPNPAYKVKVYGYPVWMGDSLGYKITWFMMNLDRNVFYDVTDYVNFAPNTGYFDPKGFGYLQRKSIMLNLQDVSGSFRPYIHTQVVDIVLKMPPNGSQTPWLVSHESLGERPMYGEGLIAMKQMPSQSIFKIDCKLTSMDLWLEAVYHRTYPLKDPYAGSRLTTPTHFTVFQGAFETTYPITDWNAPLNISKPIEEGSTIFIEFIRRTAQNDLHLSVAGMVASSI
jgi:hypothetical protein